MSGLLEQTQEIKILQQQFEAFVARKSVTIPSNNTVAIHEKELADPLV